jgi:ribulose-5-phosphate 4-epimerase/fuculose-1-phosphate aldolase
VPTDRLRFALPTSFAGAADERRHRKERLAAALRVLGRFGYDEGVAGHVTVRDPELTDHFWANPFGVPFGHVRTSDLILVNESGQVVEGRFHVNQAAFVIHAHIHRGRPEVTAVVHSHPPYGRALSALGERLEPLTQDACAFYEDHALFDAYTGVVVDDAEARRIAEALGPHKALILRNHGLLTVADSVDAAAWWFLSMERACQTQLAVRTAGKPVPITHDDAVRTREQLGNDLVAWINYQPMYEGTVRSEPDIFN